ncbi:MAG TPA: ribose-phosphate pyrophosphokinase [Gemmatimonadales bacterium]|jgi:ribose-phosphate pyrophosphokinase|nr:ribose-phosphate pyrophosphokinase [Gemmatimonadales bacterium]
MSLVLLAGTANPPLAAAVAQCLALPLAEREATRFPDGEMQVEVKTSVRGCDVYLIQPTGPPAEEHLFQLLLLADACRRAGSARLTAVVPYFGYARQDRRATGRDPVGARVVADLLATVGIDRTVSVDLHSPLEGVFGRPLEHLTAVPLLAERLRAMGTEGCVLVAPDLGATKLAERYARLLDLPVAFVHKQRLSGDEVAVRGVTGEVRDLFPIVVDDMVTTGGTVEAAVWAVLDAGARADVVVAATHGLLVGKAVARLGGLPLKRIVTSDSVPATSGTLPVERVGLGALLADAISRLHRDQSLTDLLVHR